MNFSTPSIDRFFESILNLESVEECYKYFEDICTIKEIQNMAQRLDTAILISQGLNYQTISEKADVSTATVVRVGRCLKYGSGGYKTAIERLGIKED
jgi:TrpR-related protein YerC/YecD